MEVEEGISIHLMLLFIKLFDPKEIVAMGFQYISCYCLSNINQQRSNWNVISIHLMLLFIRHPL